MYVVARSYDCRDKHVRDDRESTSHAELGYSAKKDKGNGFAA